MTLLFIIIFIVILGLYAFIKSKNKENTKKDIFIDTLILAFSLIILIFISGIIIVSTDNPIRTNIKKELISQNSSTERLYKLKNGSYYDNVSNKNSFIINTNKDGSKELKSYSGNISIKYDATEYPYVEYISYTKNQKSEEKYGILSRFINVNEGEEMIIHVFPDDVSDKINKGEIIIESETESIKTEDYLTIEQITTEE